MPRLLVLLSFLTLLPAGPARAGEPDLFTTRVRPILARYCFKCHGPDEAARKARLRLDLREVALRPTRSGKTPIVPNKPDASELIARVFSDEPTEVMPPPATKFILTEEEKRILRQWIASGAPYTAHWAFRTPGPVAVPNVKDPAWARNPIDRFVLARLEQEGLRPSPPADRYTLIRRLSLDLIGLPPTPEQADAFVNDPAPDAEARLIDSLLASPRYGERWARRWLDLARYADTNGYEKDRPRSIWPYRDWVLAAINADMPFDRFTIEQLAGDLLPGATPEQKIATGFHRNTMLNEEGGIDPLEFRFHAVTDRVATTGTVWLGLTIGCAQCHTHKFDPIAQKEYYQLFAFFNNADEPLLEVPDPAREQKRREIEERIRQLEAELPRHFPVEEKADRADTRPVEVRRQEQLDKKLAAWLTALEKQTVPWQVLTPAEARGSLPLLTVLPDHSIRASGDMSKSDTYELVFRGDLRGLTALRLEVLPDEGLPRRGPGRIYYEGPFGDFFLSEFSIEADGKKVPLVRATHSFARNGAGAEKAIDGDPQTGWSIDGGQGREHQAIFTLGSPLGDVKELRIRLLFERYYAAGLGRFRLAATRSATVPVARSLPAQLDDALLIPAEKRSPEQQRQLREQFLRTAPELAKARQPIDQLRKQLPEPPTTMVFRERPPTNPRPTHLHHRGEYLQPRETVEPGVPGVFPPLPAGLPRNRLGLARWLVSPENPLTARVTVNRQWAAFFGNGLVRTTHDFGLQGELPSHPELLDWLAGEFIRNGWSLKQLHRLIVSSATYRQSSAVSAALKARDSDNRLLARGPRVRLEAELIRDSALAVSGLLHEQLGGPSVFPVQPPGVTTEGAYGQLAWKVSPGLDRYRRGLYTFSKRTAPFAFFSTFDGPSGEVCLARRETSNNPLQALMLLNDASSLEAAQALARRIVECKGSAEEKARQLLRLCLIRPAERMEVDLLLRFHHAQRTRLLANPAAAKTLAGTDQGDVVEAAAWTACARVVLNLDEMVMKR